MVMPFQNQFGSMNIYPQRPMTGREQQYPAQVMSMRQHLGPSGMNGYLQGQGVKPFTNQWTAQMLRPKDIRPEVQSEPLVSQNQMGSLRNGLRGSVGIPPVNQPAPRMMFPRELMQRISSPVSGGQMTPVSAVQTSAPVHGGMSPAHAAQIAAMNQQQEALRQKAAAYQGNQSYQGAVDANNAQAQAMEFGRPGQFTPGVTAQQQFNGNPSSMASHYGQRFDAMVQNRPDAQETGNVPTYQERLADAGIPMARPYETPAASSDAVLTPQDRAAMKVLGNSPNDWEARKTWLAKNGFTQFTPEAAMKWGAERQQQSFAKRDMMENARRFQDQITKDRMQARAERNQLGYKIQNPELYADGMQYLPSQLMSNLYGSRQQFSQEGLSPAQAAQLSLQQQQINLERAAMTDDPDVKERILGTGQNQFNVTGSGVGSSMFGQQPQPMGMTPQAAARRALSTTDEQKKAIIDQWASSGVKPTLQDMAAAGITEQDLSGYLDDNSYGPQNGMDWLIDHTPFGNRSTQLRQKRYDWASQFGR